MAIDVRVEKGGFGAQVSGADLTRDDDFAALHRAFLDHGEGQIAALKETFHPIVRTHPETARKSLFINPGHTTHIENMPAAQSSELLGELFAHCLQEEFIYRHKWRIGDTVIWDNRRLMHNAEPYDMERYTRHMHRTSIGGDKPF